MQRQRLMGIKKKVIKKKAKKKKHLQKKNNQIIVKISSLALKKLCFYL
jgi:hypothetical protein